MSFIILFLHKLTIDFILETVIDYSFIYLISYSTIKDLLNIYLVPMPPGLLAYFR
jgi:hypothetical protein